MSASVATEADLFLLAIVKRQYAMAEALLPSVDKSSSLVRRLVLYKDVDDDVKAENIRWLVARHWPLDDDVLLACVAHILEYYNIEALELPLTLKTVLDAMIAQGLPVCALQEIYKSSTGSYILQELEPYAPSIFAHEYISKH